MLCWKALRGAWDRVRRVRAFPLAKRRMENYAMKNLLKIAVMLLGLMFGLGAFAQMPMPDTYLNS